MLNDAMPKPLTVAVPSSVNPSKKLTVPAGTPDPGSVTMTVAVKVIDWPISARRE